MIINKNRQQAERVVDALHRFVVQAVTVKAVDEAGGYVALIEAREKLIDALTDTLDRSKLG